MGTAYRHLTGNINVRQLSVQVKFPPWASPLVPALAGSKRTLVEWCSFFLGAQLDQVQLITPMLDLDGLRERITALIAIRSSTPGSYPYYRKVHVARVQQRVARGGHDIPRADIERRYIRGRVNLIRLRLKLSQLVVYDNSAQADADVPTKVAPRLLLRSVGGAIIGPSDLAQTPAWAKPIITAALKLDRSRGRAPGES